MKNSRIGLEEFNNKKPNIQVTFLDFENPENIRPLRYEGEEVDLVVALDFYFDKYGVINIGQGIDEYAVYSVNYFTADDYFLIELI